MIQKNPSTKYNILHCGSQITQCTTEKENYPPCRLIFSKLFSPPKERKENARERRKESKQIKRKIEYSLSKTYNYL